MNNNNNIANNNIANNSIEPIKLKLIENIKQWIILDKNMKIINEKTKKIRTMKKELTDQIVSTIGKNNESIKTHTIKLNDGDVLRFYEKKDYSPLSFTFIEDCLIDILEDETQIDFIMEYLRSKRDITTSIDIRRISTNNDV